MAWFGKREIKEVGLENNKIKIESPSKEPEIIGIPETPPIIPEATVEELGSSETEISQDKLTEKSEISSPTVSAIKPPPAVVYPKDELVKEIEDLLSEDLTDLFLKMNPEQQEAFRLKGEETASKIRVLLLSAKVNVKKILFLIGEWLKTIPGVSRFFLEQEAKIKTDKILLSAEEFKKGEKK